MYRREGRPGELGDGVRSTESRCHWKMLASGLPGSVNRDALLSPTSGAAMSRRFTASTRSDTSRANSAAVSPIDDVDEVVEAGVGHAVRFPAHVSRRRAIARAPGPGTARRWRGSAPAAPARSPRARSNNPGPGPFSARWSARSCPSLQPVLSSQKRTCRLTTVFYN